MAGTILCVACAQLPLKDRGVAAKSQRCPDCQSLIGVTSYGAPFRFTPVKRRRWLSPTVFTGAMIGAGLFAFVAVIVGFGLWLGEQTARPVLRKADPPAPDILTRIPEVSLEDPFPANIRPAEGKNRLATLIARIRRENQVKVDGFLFAQIEQRTELRGMPFVMGDACRLPQGQSTPFQSSVQAVRDGMGQEMPRRPARQNAPDAHEGAFWDTYLAQTGGQGTNTPHGIAALTQILGPERMSLRVGLVARMAESQRPEATRVLAKAAIFDPAGEVRTAAIKALKKRSRDESTDVLMHGLRYPLAMVANRAAQAIILLDRKDLLPQLADFLAEPAPGDPVEATVNALPVRVVREVVRVNHHRNCLLCHAPTNTGNPDEVPGVLPIPGQSFPESPSEAYGSARSTGEPMVRADTTYLRQDFSVMLPVAHASPWPEMQRFDFLVRTRVVEGKELLALQQKVQARAADYLSENHQAALQALRQLSGQDAAPTQAAWQRVLGANHAR